MNYILKIRIGFINLFLQLFPLYIIKMTTLLDEISKPASEIDWFAFETKMRKVIHELIQPPLKTVKELSTILKKDNQDMRSKIEEFEDIYKILKANEKQMMEDLRQQKIKKLTETEGRKHTERNMPTMVEIEELFKAHETSQKEHDKVNKSVEDFKKEFLRMNDSLKKIRDKMAEEIKNSISEYTQEIFDIK